MSKPPSPPKPPKPAAPGEVLWTGKPVRHQSGGLPPAPSTKTPPLKAVLMKRAEAKRTSAAERHGPAPAAKAPPAQAQPAPTQAEPLPPQSPPAPTRIPVAPAPRPPTPAIDRADPKQQSQALAEAVVSSFLDRLTEEASRKGSLTVADIKTMDAELRQKTEALRRVFERSFDDFAEARRMADWDKVRSYAFGRIVVKKFSHLFAEGAALGQAEALSRRILPAFFLALNMILGPESVDSFQQRARRIVERLREQKGAAFRWDDVYRDTAADGLALETQIHVCLVFDEFQRRQEWLMNLIDSHLAPPQAGRDDDPAAQKWRLTELSFHVLMDAFLADLRTVVGTEAGYEAMARKHGRETCGRVQRILRLFEGGLLAVRRRTG